MSKRIFLDTNIVLDYLSIREPFFEPIAGLITLADKAKLTLVVSPISFATLNYIISRHEGAKGSRDMLRQFRTLCHISTVDSTTVDKALVLYHFSSAHLLSLRHVQKATCCFKFGRS